MGENSRVCVSGAGGFIASWLVKLLLSEGYQVHGTVRNPEGYVQLEDNTKVIVDVRDLAEALKLVYEKPEAEGRYICMSHMLKAQELVEILKKIYPNYKYPKSFKEGKESKFSSHKLQNLGWKYRSLEESLIDSV